MLLQQILFSFSSTAVRLLESLLWFAPTRQEMVNFSPRFFWVAEPWRRQSLMWFFFIFFGGHHRVTENRGKITQKPLRVPDHLQLRLMRTSQRFLISNLNETNRVLLQSWDQLHQWCVWKPDLISSHDDTDSRGFCWPGGVVPITAWGA